MENQNAQQCFYMGQSIAPEHLNTLQDYSDKGQANLISSLLGYGIVNGFELETIEGHIIGVSAGLAFNVQGERLVLTEGKQVNLVQHAPNTGEKTIKIGIVVDYIKTDPVLDSMGETVYTKWEPTVRFITGEDLEEGVFELAEIKINPVGIVEIKRTSPEFINLQKQVQNTSSLSTTIDHETITANINADSLNINNKSFEDTIRDLIYPIGTTYTQYPNPSTGQFESANSPNALFGGTWELRFNDRGIFFRSEGGNSNESRNSSTGIQDTAIQHHKHDTWIGSHAHNLGTTWAESNFERYAVGGNQFGTWRSGGISSTDLGTKRSTDIVEGKRTSTETRPINMLMRIWQRIV